MPVILNTKKNLPRDTAKLFDVNYLVLCRAINKYLGAKIREVKREGYRA